MSWISKNLTLDLIAIAIGGMQSAFDRIKSEPESDWPAAEQPEAPAAVEPAPQSAPAPQPEPAPAAQEPEPESPAPQQAAAEAPAPQVNRIDEAKAHLRDISLNGGMDWITGTLFPAFGVTSLTDVPADRLPELIDKAVAFKLEKGLQ
ncbi:hypothetical protein [Corynebacterium stationis]|uniref:Uncharacterized protein n=1 Tax=Corynebacterium stationis TaxID=1705 RepID=A0AB36CM81_9CORY|nr:hypothetical protein [Corynebacterium stationis]NME89582.1 hypothetical protein [Corynebacterium stationis]